MSGLMETPKRSRGARRAPESWRGRQSRLAAARGKALFSKIFEMARAAPIDYGLIDLITRCGRERSELNQALCEAAEKADARSWGGASPDAAQAAWFDRVDGLCAGAGWLAAGAAALMAEAEWREWGAARWPLIVGLSLFAGRWTARGLKSAALGWRGGGWRGAASCAGRGAENMASAWALGALCAMAKAAGSLADVVARRCPGYWRARAGVAGAWRRLGIERRAAEAQRWLNEGELLEMASRLGPIYAWRLARRRRWVWGEDVVWRVWLRAPFDPAWPVSEEWSSSGESGGQTGAQKALARLYRSALGKPDAALPLTRVARSQSARPPELADRLERRSELAEIGRAAGLARSGEPRGAGRPRL